jgi:hypothetical protein
MRARASPFKEKGGRGLGRRGIGLGLCREGGQWLSKWHDREVIIKLPLDVAVPELVRCLSLSPLLSLPHLGSLQVSHDVLPC